MTANTPQPAQITAVVLAGGRARRMDGIDKGLVPLAGQPMIRHILQALIPQVGQIMISANRNHDAYARFGYPVISDALTGFQGPLAGMAAALQRLDTTYMCTLPCDSPFVPDDFVTRLLQPHQDRSTEISVAHDGRRMQPVFALMRGTVKDSLLGFLSRGERKIDRWFATLNTVCVDFSDDENVFINANTAADVTRVEQMLTGQQNAGN